MTGPAPDTNSPRLVWERRDGSQQVFPLLTSPMTVGRDETADIRVDEPLVSRAHARIERRGDRFVLVDLGSTNLTRVNGDVVLERELHHGDEIKFSRATCRFLLKESADPLAGGV